jgi:membrane protease YdiL (CAAX protease family)
MRQRDWFRQPMGWALLVGLSIAGIFYVYQNFSKANSLIDLDISMDRDSALAKARSLAADLSIGPAEYKQTVAFDNDSRFQTFVELEAGGIDSFKTFLKSNIYTPYYWSIRHFKEYDPHEAIFWFTPDGRMEGFYEKIAESEKGAVLTENEARKTAEHIATYRWDVDMTPYSLVEASKEEKISGRVDHTFVYERDDVTAGEGKFRIKLVVSGDKLTELTRFVQIPDEFDRRYSEMRSANDTIASISSGIIILVYGLLGVVFTLFFFIRRRWLIWKPAAIWGISIALGSVFLVTLNSLQILWFDYDTSSSQNNFILRQILGSFMNAVGFGAVIAVSSMAAEGLDRLAFPRHIRFWKLWSPDAAASKQILGQTLAGYLFAIIILGLDVLYYVTTTSHFGWWSPAGALSDPNILANYFPWLDSITTSLQAGFWEESLFRAVPIAGIFVLVKNKKHRKVWIVLVLIVQTLIFGAAHANYPNQPSYARVLEMVVPFVIMGIIYIYYGLLPGIIAHFAVDVFWISLPLWVSSYKGIWIDRILVLFFLFAPVWIILFYYFKKRKLSEVPEELRNSSWEPLPVPEPQHIESKPLQIKNPGFEKWAIPAGIIGIILWIGFANFGFDAPILKISKQKAIEIACNELEKRYHPDFADWTILSSIPSSIDTKDIFIWKEGGKKTYEAMLGKFLPPPYWEIRLVKTKGSVEEKAEEFSVLVCNDAKIYSTSHKWPESKAASSLEKDSAQMLVDQCLLKEFGKKREELKEISVSPQKLENRTDWEFIYADTIDYSFDKGQGRYVVKISGNEISRFLPYIYIPEDWNRAYTNTQSKQMIIRNTGQVIVIGILVFGLVIGIIRWTRKKFSSRDFIISLIFFASAYIVDSINNWPTILSGYSSELPFGNFMTMILISLSVTGIFLSLFNGIFIGTSVKWLPNDSAGQKMNLLKAVAFGFFAYGILTLIGYFQPQTEPSWPELSWMNSNLPLLGLMLSGIGEIIFIPALMITVFMGIRNLTADFSRLKIVITILLLIFGCALNVSSIDNPVLWILSGALTGFLILAFYILIVRFHFEWLPISFGLFAILSTIEKMVTDPSPVSLIGNFILVLISSAIFYCWYRRILKLAE